MMVMGILPFRVHRLSVNFDTKFLKTLYVVFSVICVCHKLFHQIVSSGLQICVRRRWQPASLQDENFRALLS